LNRYESRTCTFVAPSDWLAEPPYAFREKGEEGNRLGVQILERCLADMPAAASYARDQKPILAELYEGFELLQEGPQRLEGPGEGYAITFRFIDEDENPSRGKMIFFTCGPLVCQLFLSGPDGDDPERDRLFEAIAKTFAFRGAESLAGAKAGGLTSDVLRMDQAEAAKGWPGPWRKLPRCCVSVPLPIGWEVVSDERDDVLFRRGTAEIRLHRELGETNEADVWFADRLKRLQEEGDRLLGSKQGELDRGPFAAVLSEEGGAVRTWKTAAVRWRLDLFVGDQQALVWTLRAPEGGFTELRTFLESLAAAAVFLDPAEWETRVAEQWVEYVLKGHWEPQGPGLYANIQQLPLFVHLTLEPNTQVLDRLQSSILGSLRQGFPVREGAMESSLAGTFKDHEMFSYSLDGRETESSSLISIRATWMLKSQELYSVLVRGRDSQETEALSRSLLMAFQGGGPYERRD